MKQLSDENFSQEIAKSKTLVVFSAEWCGPCRMLYPILGELEEAMSGEMQICKVDIDNAKKTAEEYQITSVPTLVLCQEGREVKRTVGAADLETLRKFVEIAGV